MADILVIEDEDNIATALDFLLTRDGHRHDRIATGRGAVDRIRQTRPDLVLLDVMLPEVSGYQIVQDVRADPDLAGVRVLMMTARFRGRTAQGAGAWRRRLYRKALRTGRVAGRDGPPAVLMRRRILMLFLAALVAALVLAGLALWRVVQGGQDAVIQAAMIAGLGLLGLMTALWFLFDRHLARPPGIAGRGVADRARSPTWRRPVTLPIWARLPGDAALARERSDQALAQALHDHAAETLREKASLEAILADFGAGAVMADARGRVVFYNASAARLLPGLALDRALDTL